MLSLILPTYKEAAALPKVLPRLEAALAGRDFEVIVVDDDSPDGTAAVARELAGTRPWLHVVQRIGRSGLSSAVVEGFLAAKGDVLAVADADGQHDLAILPLLEADVRGGAAVAVGSRYAEGGDTGDWGGFRLRLSRLATNLARRICRVEVHDPMSGFFAIDRRAFETVVHHLRPKGFKILLEILAKLPRDSRVTERPFTFGERVAGQSKLSLPVEIQFLETLYDLTLGNIIPSLFLKYCIVGTIGIGVHLVVYRVLESLMPGDVISLSGVSRPLLGAVEAAIVANFALHNLWTFRHARLRGARIVTGFLTYNAACLLGALANVAVSTFLVLRGVDEMHALVAGAALAAAWNYTMSRLLTWKA